MRDVFADEPRAHPVCHGCAGADSATVIPMPAAKRQRIAAISIAASPSSENKALNRLNISKNYGDSRPSHNVDYKDCAIRGIIFCTSKSPAPLITKPHWRKAQLRRNVAVA